MKANCWMGKKTVEVQQVPDPKILNRATPSCGSPRRRSAAPTCTSTTASSRRWRRATSSATSSWARSSRSGADVEERSRSGDRVVVPFPIACGSCCRCQQRAVLALRELEPERLDGREAVGHSPAGIFGYSHMLGGYAGGQAEYARVPFADVGPIKVPDGLPDEQVLFLSDIFPTGYMGAEMCDIKPRRRRSPSGAAGRSASSPSSSAYLLGAERVIAIDRFPYRLRMAREQGRRRDDQLRGGRRLRRAEGDDRRARAGRLHRRGRHGGARARRASTPTTGSSRR